jgi:superfamily I DNA/RNA helicase
LPYLRDLNPAQRAAVENGISNGVGTPPLGHCWSNAFGPGGEISQSGTFHAISNRLLREHADSISLDSSFTVLDRADAEDRLNLVRNDLGLGGRMCVSRGSKRASRSIRTRSMRVVH